MHRTAAQSVSADCKSQSGENDLVVNDQEKRDSRCCQPHLSRHSQALSSELCNTAALFRSSSKLFVNDRFSMYRNVKQIAKMKNR